MAAPYNPRRMSEEDLASLRRSLKYFGVVEPVVVNRRTGRIAGGPAPGRGDRSPGPHGPALQREGGAEVEQRHRRRQARRKAPEKRPTERGSEATSGEGQADRETPAPRPRARQRLPPRRGVPE